MMNLSFYLVRLWEGISITLNLTLAYIPNSSCPAPLAFNVVCEQSHQIINIMGGGAGGLDNGHSLVVCLLF